MWGYPYKSASTRIERSVHPSYRGISVITPLPFGGGAGGGATIFLTPVCSVHLCSLWERICHSIFVIMSFCLTKITSFSTSLCYSVFKKHLPHFVIMSFCLQKKHLSPSVPLLFCLQKNICLPLSLCHYVFKKTSASLCHYVIMSSKKHLSLFLIMSLCRPSEDTELR